MATVYLARDEKHNRMVALKVLREELAETLGADRFLKEIEIAAGLNHPNVLTLIDSGVSGNFLFYVMPYVEGQSLRALLNEQKHLPLDETLKLAREVADALTYAHSQRVVHRDIKPENILLSHGHAVVADFGIARALTSAGGTRLTRTGFPIGTPGYMSPEQAAGNTDLDGRTDVYSLACVVFEMLLGEPPGFWLDSATLATDKLPDLTREQRDALDALPRRVERALVQGMAMKREARFADPGDFVTACEKESPVRKRYDRDEMERIIGDAAGMETGTDTEDALTIGTIREIANEVGISPTKVERAANKLRHHDGTTYSRWLGGANTIVLEATLAAEVPIGSFDQLIEEVRVALDTEGYAKVLGSTMTWRTNMPRKNQDEMNLNDWLSFEVRYAWRRHPRNVIVRIICGAGVTRIRIEERLSKFIGDLFGGVVGGVGITGVVVSFSVGIAALGLPVAAAALSAAAFAGGSYGISRAVYSHVAGGRYRELSLLLENLSAQVLAITGKAGRLPPG